MVCSVVVSLPIGSLPSGRPLTWLPPASNLFDLGRIGQVIDDGDGANVAFQLGRDVSVARIEVEAMHADAAGLDKGDLLWIRWRRDIQDSKTRMHRLRSSPAALIVHYQQMVSDPGLVRMGVGGHLELREDPGCLWIGDIHDGSTDRWFHVPHVSDSVFD